MDTDGRKDQEDISFVGVCNPHLRAIEDVVVAFLPGTGL